jgi:hypothetical protein
LARVRWRAKPLPFQMLRGTYIVSPNNTSSIEVPMERQGSMADRQNLRVPVPRELFQEVKL